MARRRDGRLSAGVEGWNTKDACVACSGVDVCVQEATRKMKIELRSTAKKEVFY